MRHRSAGRSPQRLSQRPSGTRSRRIVGSAAALALLAATGVAVVIGTSSASSGNLLTNAGFESGLQGWHRLSSPERLEQVPGGHSGSHAAKLSSSTRRTVALMDSPNAVSSTHKGDVYSVAAWVRTTTPSVTAVLRIREVTGGALVNDRVQRMQLSDQSWHKLSFHYTVARSGDSLDYNVLAQDLALNHMLLVDDTWLSLSSTGTTPTSSPTTTPKPSPTPTPTPTPTPSPTSTPPIVPTSTSTFFGSSVQQDSGQTFAQAYQREVGLYGSLPIDRVYYSGLPTGWPGAAGYAGKPVAVSFKGAPQQVLTGQYDKAIAAWFAAAPRDRPIFWTYFHEPENDVEAGRYTAAQFRAAFARIAGLADRAGNPNLHSTLILMCYTLEPSSNRSFASYYPGSAAVDVLGWDCYNAKWSSGGYIDPSVQFAKVLATSTSTGKPFAIAELGSKLATGDGSGTGRAAWLRATGAWLAAHHAKYVTYFDSTVAGEYRLRDAASIAAWRYCISTY